MSSAFWVVKIRIMHTVQAIAVRDRWMGLLLQHTVLHADHRGGAPVAVARHGIAPFPRGNLLIVIELSQGVFNVRELVRSLYMDLVLLFVTF